MLLNDPIETSSGSPRWESIAVVIFLIPFKSEVIYYLFSERRGTQHSLIQWGCSQTQQEGDNCLFSAFSHHWVAVDIQLMQPCLCWGWLTSALKLVQCMDLAFSFFIINHLHLKPSFLLWDVSSLPREAVGRAGTARAFLLLFLTRLLLGLGAQELCCWPRPWVI